MLAVICSLQTGRSYWYQLPESFRA